METSIEYRICTHRKNNPRVKQDVCQACQEDCEFAGGRPQASRWLKDCEICNVGLCSYIDDLVNAGTSIREAARRLEKESEGLYSPEAIRQRYNYYKNPDYKTGRNSTTSPQLEKPQSSSSKPKQQKEKPEQRLEENFTPISLEEPPVQESDDLQNLKFYWLRASDQDRLAFREWIEITNI